MARVTLDGVPASGLARRWRAPRVALFTQLGSCLDAVHDAAAQGAPVGTVVVAEEQTAGRGREGRAWRSPPGGAWLALLVRQTPAHAGIVAIRAGLVLADAVDELVGRPIARLKWPNDVLLDDRKLAGVLCEGRWQGDRLLWLAVGIGVNVTNEIPTALRATATALREHVPEVTRLALLDRIVPALAHLSAGGAVLTEGERAAFAGRDWLHGRRLAAPLAGRAAGVRPDGALLVEGPTGTVAARDGHVALA